MLVLYGKPFLSKMDTFNAFMNETFIFVYLMGLIGLSDFNYQMEDKESLGQMPVIVVFCNILVNFIKFAYNTYHSIKKYCRERRVKKYQATTQEPQQQSSKNHLVSEPNPEIIKEHDEDENRN
jgi:large-conductance mechanosensitive channel